MTKDEAYEKQRQERLALQRENRKLKAVLDELVKGTYESPEKAANLKAINRLTHENIQLKKQIERYRGLWKDQIRLTENFRTSTYDAKWERDKALNDLEYYRDRCERLEASLSAIAEKPAPEVEELEAEIMALKDALLREKAKNGTDGTNSGIPTSQTPYGSKKVIPNSRVRSGRKRGGQSGHMRHSLKAAGDIPVSEAVDHTLERCPDCDSEDLTFIEKKEKDVLDYEVVVRKKRHYFWVYQCMDCGHIVHSPIPLQLKEHVQYGPNIQALVLALQNIGFVSINRTKELTDGISGNMLRLSEGFISKLQKRASDLLAPFCEELRLQCLRSDILHWDDTVVYINTERACMRFYGNDRFSLYRAHRRKNREGVDEDAILGLLGPETTVVHDHLMMNYNSDFVFRNAECMAHLTRDLQKISDVSGHSWSMEMKDLISGTIRRRNCLTDQGIDHFSDEDVSRFFSDINMLLDLADEEHTDAYGRFYGDDERRLIARLRQYQESHFLWVRDFTVPPTNNIAERGLRSQKVKLKISGQYQTVENAGYFASIRSYIDTCRKNGVRVYTALTRLMSGNPYTLKEVLGGA